MLYPKDSTCRTCLISSHDIFSIHEEQESISIETKIETITNIKLSDNKLLPTSICDVCKRDLNVAYNFILKCYSSENTLLKSLSETEEESRINSLLDDVKVKLESDEEFDNNDAFESFLPVKLESADGLDLNIEKTISKLSHKTSAYNNNSNTNNGNSQRKKRKKKDLSIPNPIQCYTCGLICISQSSLATHQRIHTGERPFKCLQCHLSFAQKGTMKAHMQRKHNIGTQPREMCYICETCGKQFSRRRDAVVHMRLHTGEKPYACPFCPKRFTQIGPLIRHKRIHTGEKPYSCQECGKRFADKTMVKIHSTVHSNEKNYTCNICGKAVKSKNTLLKHIQLHSQDKSNVCDQCGMAFAVKGNLKLHIAKVHSEKSGICSTCSKTCSDLEKHMRKHTGEAPFQCEICNRRFTLNSSLTTHLNKHKNAEKFKCTIDNCTKSFCMEFMLDFHIKKYHTNETPFICSFCGRGFFRVGDLTKHLRATHNIEKRSNLTCHPNNSVKL